MALKYRQVSLIVRYNVVLFPFDSIEFQRELATQGFILREPEEPIPLGTRREISGSVARKGNVSVHLDTPRKVVGVHALDVKTALEEMDSLEALIKEEFGIDSSGMAEYYEFLAGVYIRAERSPVDSWANIFENLPVIKKASDIIGMDSTSFGIRLVPKGGVPNQVDWFDIRIEPLVQSATDYHSVQVVYRRTSRDEVFAFVRGFDGHLAALLSLVEQG